MKSVSLNWDEIDAAMAEEDAAKADSEQGFSPLFIAAAMRSSFLPEALAKELPSGEKLRRDTKDLIQACDVVRDRGTLKWQLKNSIRKEVYKSLGSLAAMKPYLPQGEKTKENTLQKMLSDYVQGTAQPLKEQSLQELGASYQIAGWLHEIDTANIPAPIEVQAQLRIKELTAPFRKLTEFFQGREDELKKLRAYQEWPPLLIHGLGGAGKSTLISKFILEHLEDSPKGHIPFIYLDFDRPGISIREPLTLLFEGLRQLILQFPEYEKILEEYRRGWENDLLDTEQSQVRSYAQKGSTRSGERRHYMRDFDTIWIEILNQGQKPLLFVLDSFEEVQYRATHNDLIELFNFLEEMSASVPQFRAVISGRSELPKEFNVQPLFIGPFDEKAAMGYLAHKGIKDAELAARIFKHIGGNPLNLTLAASVVLKEMEKGDQSHDWLLLRMEGEHIQELLFRRNLEHIHKQEVRELAFPGLTVRFISPPVIQHILAKPCGLGEINEQKATDLFHELKKETFLVNIDEQGRFRFRPDLRKLLIDLMRNQDPERTRQIHDLAVEFYKKEDSLEARAEHIYHALRRGDDPNSLGQVVQPELQPYLENSLSEFSPNNYMFLASEFKLEVPEEVRQRADLGFWEEKMVSELEGFLAQGHVSSFPGMLERLKEKTERTDNSPLRFLEASFYELTGDLQRAYEIGKIALRDVEKSLAYQRIGYIYEYELIARIRARQGKYAKAQENTERGIAVAKQQNQPLQAIGMTFDLMQLLRRQGKPIENAIEELLVYTAEKDGELEKLFLEEYGMQKYIPSYNDPVPTLSFLKKHLARFLPSNVWGDKNYPGTIAAWLEKTIVGTMSDRWLNAADFQGFIEKTKTLAGNLDQLEKHSKARLDVFLREIIPPSVYEISVYDLVVFAEIEGRVGELTEVKSKGYQQEVFKQEEKSIEVAVSDENEQPPPDAEPSKEDTSSLNIFMSFVKEDEDLKIELDKHLTLLRRTPGIQIWDMDKINAGEKFQVQVDKNLRSAHIILLLVSADYMSNDDVYENEMMVALKRQDEGVTVVPIYLRPTYMVGSPLEKLQGLPRDNRAVSNFKNRDEAYNEIAVGLRRLVDRMIKA